MEMNVVKRELTMDQTYPNLIDSPSLENEEITIKNEVDEEINEGTNVNIKVEAWPCEYIENMDDCKGHLEQILSSEIQIKEETPEEYATPLKVTLTEIKKEIDEVNHQEQTDLTPAKLHVFQCIECSYSNEDTLKFKDHIRRIHKKSNSTEYLRCEKCKYKTLNKQLLDLHVLLWHSVISNIKKYKCKRCNYKTVDSECYSKHLKNNRCLGSTVEDGTVYKCELAEIKKEIDKADRQEQTDLTLVKLHVFRCVECSYNNEDLLKFKNHIRKTHKRSNLSEYLTCEQCKYKTLNKQLLDLHVLLSHSDVSNIKKYECKPCNYQTVDSECYSKHLKKNKCSGWTAKERTVYKCELCSYQTTGKLYLKRHQLTHKKHEKVEDAAAYKCELCSYQTTRKLYFKRHRWVHETHRKFYKCKLCDYKALRNCSLRNHMRVHEGCPELKYKCEDCNYSTSFKNSLEVHKASHKHVSNIEFKYKCTECSYNTTNEEDFQRHKSRHTKRLIYRCKLCDYKVLGRLLFIKHMTQTHGDKTGPVYKYRCEICNCQINHKRNLKKHMMRHEKNREWLFCAHCNYRVKDKEILQGHIMKFHMEAGKALQYDCVDCNFSTFFKNEYDKHVSRHKRETDCERFKCDDCTFETIDKLYFREHKFFHERPEMFECELCNYKVMAKRPLKNHVIHMHGDRSNNKKFTCDQCDYSTIYKTCYTDHMTKHVDHSKLPSFKCEFCDFETVNRQYLRVHVRQHNPDASSMKEFTCKWCSYKTVRKRDLLTHMASKCACKAVKIKDDG